MVEESMSEPMLYGEMVQELARVRAEYEQFIIDRERERIISLLNEHAPIWNFDGVDCLDECRHYDWLAHFISFIEGENK
jgi:hypothetical protein